MSSVHRVEQFSFPSHFVGILFVEFLCISTNQALWVHVSRTSKNSSHPRFTPYSNCTIIPEDRLVSIPRPSLPLLRQLHFQSRISLLATQWQSHSDPLLLSERSSYQGRCGDHRTSWCGRDLTESARSSAPSQENIRSLPSTPLIVQLLPTPCVEHLNSENHILRPSGCWGCPPSQTELNSMQKLLQPRS